MGSARSLRLKSSSQKKQSQYCDTAPLRHIRFGMSAPKRTLEPLSDTRQRVRSAFHFSRRVGPLERAVPTKKAVLQKGHPFETNCRGHRLRQPATPLVGEVGE